MRQRLQGGLIAIIAVIAVAMCAGLARLAVFVWEALGAMAKYG